MCRYYYFCIKYAINVLRLLINRTERERNRRITKNKTKFRETSKK